MRILLIRHGETPLNVARVLQPADTPLSARGIAQARALAQRLAGDSVQHIVSSDLPRARHTAELIAAATGASLTTSALLRERNFGDWRGQPYDRLAIDPLTMREAPPGGESAEMFEARVALAFAHIVDPGVNPHAAEALPRGALAVVTHGLVLRAMLSAHIRLPEGSASPQHLGNTSLSEFAAAPPHLATLVNCMRHLDDTAGDDPQALSGG
jgi:broad specificity phosphatase PhoE